MVVSEVSYELFIDDYQIQELANDYMPSRLPFNTILAFLCSISLPA